MGALTQSKLDRQVVARYFAFLVISQLVIFTLIGVIFRTYPRNRYQNYLNQSFFIPQNTSTSLCGRLGKRAFRRSLANSRVGPNVSVYDFSLKYIAADLPGIINSTYINQSSYWLTFFPYLNLLN